MSTPGRTPELLAGSVLWLAKAKAASVKARLVYYLTMPMLELKSWLLTAPHKLHVVANIMFCIMYRTV